MYIQTHTGIQYRYQDECTLSEFYFSTKDLTNSNWCLQGCYTYTEMADENYARRIEQRLQTRTFSCPS